MIQAQEERDHALLFMKYMQNNGWKVTLEAIAKPDKTYEGILADEDSENESERICDRIALSQCIGRLPPLWKKIVLLRYYRNMTQQQTANALGLTQVKVSREEKKILVALRHELSGS